VLFNLLFAAEATIQSIMVLGRLAHFMLKPELG